MINTFIKWRVVLFIVCLGISLLACTSSTTVPPAVTTQATIKQPAKFDRGMLELTPSTILVGEKTIATLTVTNSGESLGDHTIVLEADGIDYDSKTISLNPGESQSVKFELKGFKAGKHQIHVELQPDEITLNVLKPEMYTIRYDGLPGAVEDYEYTGRYVYGDYGAMVRFTPPVKPFRIINISISGCALPAGHSEKLYDSLTFDLSIYSTDNQTLWTQSYPWRRFHIQLGNGSSGTEGLFWNTFWNSDVFVNDDFYVELVSHSAAAGTITSGQASVLVLGSERSTDTSDIVRSSMSLKGTPVTLLGDDKLHHNWYIRVEGDGPPKDMK